MGGMKDLFGDTPWAPPKHYPDSPGWRDPTTSLEAARKIESKAATLRGKVLALLAAMPSTVHEAAAELGEEVPSIQPRFSELRADGKIKPTGERRRNHTGMSAHVWEVVQRS